MFGVPNPSQRATPRVGELKLSRLVNFIGELKLSRLVNFITSSARARPVFARRALGLPRSSEPISVPRSPARRILGVRLTPVYYRPPDPISSPRSPACLWGRRDRGYKPQIPRSVPRSPARARRRFQIIFLTNPPSTVVCRFFFIFILQIYI